MGFKVGVCGLNFGERFVAFLQRHPLVSGVSLADADEKRLTLAARRNAVRDTHRSFEELLASDVDAVGVFTQRWLHAPQVVQALRAGKHVLCAVPAAVTVEEMQQVVEAVQETGLTFMLCETSYYYPAALYCRDRFRRGDFGRFVFGEAEYLHDMSHRFYDAYRDSNGPDWKRYASFPPMLYPTHSVSMILSVTGARMTSVSCLGQRDAADDGVFREDVSLWGNAFSNQTALFRTS
ncbi:MAG TPA: Gfo/Idh/MocA family oxidoreductase, partial [Deinococcales bacterium]|nr:Gfo/Idh/MocA family oxidoreductase [Deinococcales bacterium]